MITTLFSAQPECRAPLKWNVYGQHWTVVVRRTRPPYDIVAAPILRCQNSIALEDHESVGIPSVLVVVNLVGTLDADNALRCRHTRWFGVVSYERGAGDSIVRSQISR